MRLSLYADNQGVELKKKKYCFSSGGFILFQAFSPNFTDSITIDVSRVFIQFTNWLNRYTMITKWTKKDKNGIAGATA